MPDYNTPGVYIEELNAFPNSIAQVETAIPAFIGYTEKSEFKGKSFLNKPVRITSQQDYLNFFGGAAPGPEFEIREWQNTKTGDKDFDYDGKTYSLLSTGVHYRMYSGIKMFYANGGGACYILSVGHYENIASLVDTDPFEKALNVIKKETEPSMIVIPDLVEFIAPGEQNLNKRCAQSYQLQNQVLDHCGTMKNRVAILDIPEGFQDEPNNPPDCITTFRDNINPTDARSLSYAAVYYPWLLTSIYQKSEISYTHLAQSKMKELGLLLKNEFSGNPDAQKKVLQEFEKIANVSVAWNKLDETQKQEVGKAHLMLQKLSKVYETVLYAILKKLNLLAPSSAMAGIFASVDYNRGVWKAPANVSIAGAKKPAIQIDDESQGDLNSPINGKSVNAIRSFPGNGILVWGARTLDSNSLDFRYINVRRTLIMIEQSIQSALRAYVFEPNVANTWTTVRSMVKNFLTDLWKQGALAGAKPEDAFTVQVGLGVTMTQLDIDEGRMIVEIGMAVVRPAEFIILRMVQQMQQS